MSKTTILMATAAIAVYLCSASTSFAQETGTPPPTDAPCITAEAALRGSRAAYNARVEAADRVAEMNQQVSDLANNCIGGITSVITLPSLSLDSIFDQLIDAACRAVDSEINQVVGTFDDYVGDTLSVPELNVGVGVRSNNGGEFNPTIRTRELDTPSPTDWW